MNIKVKENHDSISIKIIDENKTATTIKIGRYGYEIIGSALPNFIKESHKICGDIDMAVSKYLGKTVDLCGCKNYGEFARKIESVIKPAKTWYEVIDNLNGMKDN